MCACLHWSICVPWSFKCTSNARCVCVCLIAPCIKSASMHTTSSFLMRSSKHELSPLFRVKVLRTLQNKPWSDMRRVLWFSHVYNFLVRKTLWVGTLLFCWLSASICLGVEWNKLWPISQLLPSLFNDKQWHVQLFTDFFCGEKRVVGFCGKIIRMFVKIERQHIIYACIIMYHTTSPSFTLFESLTLRLFQVSQQKTAYCSHILLWSFRKIQQYELLKEYEYYQHFCLTFI